MDSTIPLGTVVAFVLIAFPCIVWLIVFRRALRERRQDREAGRAPGQRQAMMSAWDEHDARKRDEIAARRNRKGAA